MLTSKDHPIVINKNRHVIKIWDDEKNRYEEHTPEFIQDLCEMVNRSLSGEQVYGVIYE